MNRGIQSFPVLFFFFWDQLSSFVSAPGGLNSVADRRAGPCRPNVCAANMSAAVPYVYKMVYIQNI